jgi:hypothetical protein
LEDLAKDRDHYIGDDMFKPYDFYSADFVVKFWDETTTEIQARLDSMQTYYNVHQEFFKKLGYDSLHDPRLLPLRFPVAQLIETMPREQLLQEIKQRQQVSRVYVQ